jgi:hypothetical protein
VPDDFLRALVDPSAPLPAGWPTGVWGAFLLFLIPIGGGIPAGVLMARDAGAPLPLIALLYFVSDVIQALTTEPMLQFALFVGRWIPLLRRLGERIARFTQRTALGDGSKRGPFSLMMLSFSVSPLTSRTAAVAAGHGSIAGWGFAIAGDMLYFGVLMLSTLWVSSVIGDERLTVLIVLVVTLVLPSLIRRWRQAHARAAVAPQPVLAAQTVDGASVQARALARPAPAMVVAPRRSGSRKRGGRRRR